MVKLSICSEYVRKIRYKGSPYIDPSQGRNVKFAKSSSSPFAHTKIKKPFGRRLKPHRASPGLILLILLGQSWTWLGEMLQAPDNIMWQFSVVSTSPYSSQKGWVWSPMVWACDTCDSSDVLLIWCYEVCWVLPLIQMFFDRRSYVSLFQLLLNAFIFHDRMDRALKKDGCLV